MAIAAGSRLGPYEVLAPLGAGGMGEVWRARDTRLSREVAIKVLPAEVSEDAGQMRRFEKEARAASALNHPNIVTVHEIGREGSTDFLVMELVPGRTLRDLLPAGPLPVKKMLAIAAQIADGLSRAHEAGIVHRDLKPENLMVAKDGLVKILDFGLAKRTGTGSGSDEGSHLPTETGTSPGLILGTVGYMSPEQATGQALDFRSDQFALGSILYEMATGKRAFQKKTAVDTLSAILNEEPQPVSAVNPQVTAPLRWVIDRCLAKDAAGRYASTIDLARDLADLRDRLPEVSHNRAAVGLSSRARLVRPLVALGLAVAGLLAGGFGSRSFWRDRFTSHAVLRQVTFGRAGILDAKIAPDGQIVYATVAVPQTKGNPGHMFAARPGNPEPRSLGLPPANVLAISSSGELAMLVGGFPRLGTLATASLAGGAPRELLEMVRRASFSPKGNGLAVVHVVGGKTRIEFPVGKTLYEPSGWAGPIEFSPKGDLIAFTDHGVWAPGSGSAGELTVVDLSGKRRRIGRIPMEFKWSRSGDEIWFNDFERGSTTIQAMTLSGKRRFVASFPGDFVLHDLSRTDGSLLLERMTEELEMIGGVVGVPVERNLSWLDGSIPVDLSNDGKTLLFNETRQAYMPAGAVYKRSTDGSDAVRLGDGHALSLSPDGLWALCTTADGTGLVLLPTGPGQPQPLALPGFHMIGAGAKFFPDGRRILIRGVETGVAARLYVFDLQSRKAMAMGPADLDIQGELLISPDGKSVSAVSSDGKSYLYDVESGNRRLVPTLGPDFYAIQWCADGRSLFVRTQGTKPLKVYRMDLVSGQRQLWKEFFVADVDTGVLGVIPTPDGKSYVYGYRRYFADLFLAEGLR
jgi:eukaryotic-like serine/threonine-protein kinase